MATSEALIKYYDCLRESFNKIQDKDNKTALINAALRPKIREEFEKSQELLVSYLNYIQVFSLIYSDKFVSICNNIITPLFKENEITTIGSPNVNDNDDHNPSDTNSVANDNIIKVHNTIQAIIQSKSELADDFIHSVIKVFPSVHGSEPDRNQVFLKFLKNCLMICTYIEGEALMGLITKTLEKLNPPNIDDLEEEAEKEEIRLTLSKSYELIYECLNDLNEEQLDKIITSLLTVYTREFLSSPVEDHLNYLVLYVCSLKAKFMEFFIEALWNVFINSSRPLDDRRASVKFASSMISRANYANLDLVFNYLEKAKDWCIDFLDNRQGRENVANFYALAQSMFYLVTQRYREMYENESIERLQKLNFDRIVNHGLKPLDVCDSEIEQRFQEVSTLYHLMSNGRFGQVRKKRRVNANQWKVPFKETHDCLPKRIQPIYRCYYDHRNFTVYRE